MDPKLLQLIEEAVKKGITSQSLLLIIILVVTAGLAAYLGAYFKKQGEQKAQDENFNNLLSQLKIQTEATEAIKRDIAIEVASSSERIKSELAKELAEFESTLTENVQFKTEILIPQIEAYKSLWAMTYVVRPTRDTPITDKEKKQLTADMTVWYYASGNGIFLTLEAGKLWRQARGAIKTEEDSGIIKKFKDLRTQIKIDIRVYGIEEAETEIGD